MSGELARNGAPSIGGGGRVLIAAGSDSGGGAGIQADIKVVTALGGYAATAIAALTAQDTERVHEIVGMAPEFVTRQMRVVLDDIGADAIKTGMLHTTEVIVAVAELLRDKAASLPLVVDPVAVASGGARLLEPAAESALRAELIPIATLITPNLPEAEMLTGLPIDDIDAMHRAANALLSLGAESVLLTGGHLAGGRVADILITEDGEEVFEDSRIETRHTHGTGCTISSAIATGLAQGLELRESVLRARAFVRQALQTAPGFGRGHGPLNFSHDIAPYRP